jgi:hypothetical protein
MKFFTYRPRAARLRTNASVALALFALALIAALTLGGSAGAATAVPLASATSFAVLAGAGVTNTGPTTVNGDLGTFPTTSFTGGSTLTLNGTNHGGDGITQQAQNDLTAAYTNAASQGPTNPIAADLVGLTLTPGVYNSASSIGLSGALTLNGGGDPNAVFVFQAGSSLTTGSASQINLINGAQSCNVFWQVGSSATLGTGSSFIGTILALTSITVTTGVTVDGRVLARNGAVTLDTDTITTSRCATTPSSTTPGSTPTTTTPGSTPTGTPGTSVPAVPLTPAEKRKKALAKKKVALKKKQQQVAKKTPVTKRTTAAKPPRTPTFGFTG